MRVREIGRFRIDLGAMTDEHARAVLARNARSLRHLRGDALAVARVAVLEAELAEADVEQAITTALAHEAQRMPALPTERCCDGPDGLRDPDEIRLREALRREIAYLPPRQAIVLEALLCGETLDEVGKKLGISRNIAHRAACRARGAVVRVLG